ncbi:hypothetical protein [Novipirellula maiorica]|nr:hypothetical protein [Rhodopirellula maiorica]
MPSTLVTIVGAQVVGFARILILAVETPGTLASPATKVDGIGARPSLKMMIVVFRPVGMSIRYESAASDHLWMADMAGDSSIDSTVINSQPI